MANNNTLFVGKVLHRFNEVSSTNEVALNYLSKSKPTEGTAISASFQTTGKGQIGSAWEAEAGKNLLLSVIFYPRFLSPTKSFELNVMTSLAVRDWAASKLNQSVYVKWPNDIIVNDTKLAGILIQNSLRAQQIQHSIIGVGVNVNQKAFGDYAPAATSLSLLSGSAFSLELAETELFSHLESRYLQLRRGAFEELRADYLRQLWKYGELATFVRKDSSIFQGRISGVDAIGKLLIRREDVAEESFGMKEVKLWVD